MKLETLDIAILAVYILGLLCLAARISKKEREGAQNTED